MEEESVTEVYNEKFEGVLEKANHFSDHTKIEINCKSKSIPDSVKKLLPSYIGKEIAFNRIDESGDVDLHHSVAGFLMSYKQDEKNAKIILTTDEGSDKICLLVGERYENIDFINQLDTFLANYPEFSVNQKITECKVEIQLLPF